MTANIIKNFSLPVSHYWVSSMSIDTSLASRGNWYLKTKADIKICLQECMYQLYLFSSETLSGKWCCLSEYVLFSLNMGWKSDKIEDSVVIQYCWLSNLFLIYSSVTLIILKIKLEELRSIYLKSRIHTNKTQQPAKKYGLQMLPLHDYRYASSNNIAIRRA